jgi:hypothetical protein
LGTRVRKSVTTPRVILLLQALSVPSQELERLFQSLTKLEPRQAQPTPLATHPRNGRHPYGSVAKAVVQVLAEAEHALRPAEIRAGAEALLGSNIAYSSIKTTLRTGCNGSDPRFVRHQDGTYRLGPRGAGPPLRPRNS